MWESILGDCYTENGDFYNNLSKLIRDALYNQGLVYDGEEIVPIGHSNQNPPQAFKAGDWVLYGGDAFQVKKVYGSSTLIIRGDYEVQCDKGDCKLWTIADAKGGDVLVDKYDNIAIFVGIENRVCWISCIYCGEDGTLISPGDDGTCGCHLQIGTVPATKEQRDTLFKSMHDAGYEWDADTKQLKKIDFDDVDPNHLIHEHIDPQELVLSELGEFENRLGEIIFPTWDIMQGCESCQADINHVKELAKDLLSIARKQIAGEIDVDDVVEKWNGTNQILPPDGWYRLGVMDVKNLIEKGEV